MQTADMIEWAEPVLRQIPGVWRVPVDNRAGDFPMCPIGGVAVSRVNSRHSSDSGIVSIYGR